MIYKRIGEKPHKYWFYGGVGIFLLVVVIGTLVTMNWLWGYLDEYEKGTVDYAFDRYVSLVNQKKFDQIYEDSGFKETEFAPKSDYIKNLSKRYEKKLEHPSFLKIMSKNAEKVSYELRDADKKIDTVSVVKTADGYVVKTEPPKFLPAIQINAPHGIDITVNGKSLDEGYISGEPNEVVQFLGIKEKTYTPTLLSYKVDGFIEPPKVEASTQGGAVIELVQAEDGGYTVYTYADDNKQESLKKLALEASQTYAEFITNDATTDKVLAYIYKDCNFYNEVKTFDNKWYSTHSGFKYEDIKVEKAEDYSHGLYSVTVSFNYIVKRYNKDYPFPSKYAVALIEKGGKTMVAGIYPK